MANAHSTQAMDWLFSNYNALMLWGGTATGSPGTLAIGPPLPDPEDPPQIQNEADLRAANEWVLRERARLQQYTELQLARIAEEHQALLSQKHLNEQSMILGCQELSGKEDLLTRQSAALQKQATELSQREQALVGVMGQWTQSHGELDDLRLTRVLTEEETARQRTLVEALQTESMSLQQARAAIQAELEEMTRALGEQSAARTKQQAYMRAHQTQMEQRLRALDQAEQAATRRAAEFDELEIRLHEEFEEQERQLALQRRELAALEEKLRQRLEPAQADPRE